MKDGLAKLGKRIVPILFPDSHLSHAASCLYPYPCEEAASLTLIVLANRLPRQFFYDKRKMEIKKEFPFLILLACYILHLNFKPALKLTVVNLN